MAATEAPDAPEAEAAVRHLAAGPPPADPSEDLIWVPTILALTSEAIERSLAEESASGSAPPPDEG